MKEKANLRGRCHHAGVADWKAAGPYLGIKPSPCVQDEHIYSCAVSGTLTFSSQFYIETGYSLVSLVWIDFT